MGRWLILPLLSLLGVLIGGTFVLLILDALIVLVPGIILLIPVLLPLAVQLFHNFKVVFGLFIIGILIEEGFIGLDGFGVLLLPRKGVTQIVGGIFSNFRAGGL